MEKTLTDSDAERLARFKQAMAQYRDPADGINIRNAEKLRALDRAMIMGLAEQREAFLQQHAEKVETHVLGFWPSETRWTDEETQVTEQLICLVPKDQSDPITYDYVLAHLPHAVLSYEIKGLPRPHFAVR